MTEDDAFDAAEKEYFSAITKFPPFTSAHEGYAVLAEEVDELWDAVKMKQGDPKRIAAVKAEAIQVAAMALRILIDLC